MSKLDDFWLRDKMYDLLGLYDNITHDFIKECAKTTTNVMELKKKLIDSSFPADDEFCQELLSRFAGIKPLKPTEYELWEKE